MENKNLESIIAKRLTIFEVLTDGELSDEFEKELDALDLSQADKIDGYYYRMEELNAAEDKLKQIEEKFSIAKGRAKKMQNFMKERLKNACIALETNKIEGNQFKFTLGKAKPILEIDDCAIADMLAQFGKVETTTTINKRAIEEAIALGFKFEGVRLVPNYSLRKGVK